MSAATTIAPALTPVSAPRLKPQKSEPAVIGRPPLVEPQHMQALARANEVRLARAELKRAIATGRRDIVTVVAECPWEAESMAISELLSSQRRWGRARSRKVLVSVGLAENKRLGSLTDRQQRLLVRALTEKQAGR